MSPLRALRRLYRRLFVGPPPHDHAHELRQREWRKYAERQAATASPSPLTTFAGAERQAQARPHARSPFASLADGQAANWTRPRPKLVGGRRPKR